MANNLNYKFKSYREPEVYWERSVRDMSMSENRDTYALNLYIDLIHELGRGKVSKTQILEDLLGYAPYNSPSDTQGIQKLSNDLLPLVSVTKSIRKSLGLPQKD